MVDVKVRVHDEVHLVGAGACARKLLEQPRARVGHERARLRPESGVDEHRCAGSANENRVDREPPLVGAAQRRKRLREGREASLGVHEDRNVERAHSHSGSGFRPPNPSSTRCQ